MSDKPVNEQGSDKPAEKSVEEAVNIQLAGKAVASAQIRARLISYGTIKDAKERVLRQLAGSGESSFSEIVTETTLPFELVSVVIGELERDGKVTVARSSAEGLNLVQPKK
jgi:predicted methyltransferase